MPKPTYVFKNNKVYEVFTKTDEREIASSEIQQKISDLEAELLRLKEDLVKVKTEETKIVA